jgi:hypothetical protein
MVGRQPLVRIGVAWAINSEDSWIRDFTGNDMCQRRPSETTEFEGRPRLNERARRFRVARRPSELMESSFDGKRRKRRTPSEIRTT